MTIQERPAWWVFYVPGEFWEDPEYVKSRSKGTVYWTCHRDTRKGDFALLYAKSPISAVVAIMSVLEDAEINREQEQFAPEPYWCETQIEKVLRHPLHFAQMRQDRELYEAWGAVRASMQAPGGMPPRISEEVLSLLRSRIPELRSFLAGE